MPSRPEDGSQDQTVSTARLLGTVWANLVDMLGTAAAATVLKRAIKRGCERLPELEGLRVVREGWEYRCVPPEAWHRSLPSETPAFIALVRDELFPILRELTGPIVLQRLEDVPELEELGLSREDT